MSGLLDKLAGVELSDEQRQAIEATEQEAERLRLQDETRAKAERDKEAETFLASLKDTPFDHPGVLKYIDSVFTSDDGMPAIELSEDLGNGRRSQPEPKSASEVIRGLFAALPKDKEGKLTLSAQASRVPDDPKPPEGNDPDADDKRTPQERAASLAEELSVHGLGVSFEDKNGGKA